MTPSAVAPRHLKAAVFLVAFLGSLLLQAACLPRIHAHPLPSAQQGGGGSGTAAREEKVRLGSSPPSCRGKCYECDPCTAVQVPTASSAAPSGPARVRAAATAPLVAALSNYKPVGWKCRCRDRVYEP